MSSSSSSHMDEGSDSENEYDYDDELDDEEEIEDDDAAEEDHDDGEDDDDEPDDVDVGGADQLFDFGSTIHGVVHELRRLNRNRDGAGEGVYDGILGALNQSAANLGFPQIVLPSQSVHGGVLSALRGTEPARGEGHNPHQRRLPFGQLPLARRIHPMLRREQPFNASTRRQRSLIFRGEEVPIDVSSPTGQSATSTHVDTLQNLLRGLSFSSNSDVAREDGTVQPSGAHLGATADQNEPVETSGTSLDRSSPDSHVRSDDTGGAAGSQALLRVRFSGPRDFNRVYSEDRHGALPSARFDNSLHAASLRQMNETGSDHWAAGPLLSAAGGRSALSNVLMEPSANALSPAELRGHRGAAPSTSRPQDALNDSGASADRPLGLVLVNRKLTSRVEIMLKELAPAHDKLQKRKDQYDAARRAAAAARAREEIALAAEKASAATAKIAADAKSKKASSVEAERVAGEADGAELIASGTPAPENPVQSEGVIDASAIATGIATGSSEPLTAPSAGATPSTVAVASGVASTEAASTMEDDANEIAPAQSSGPASVAPGELSDVRVVSAAEPGSRIATETQSATLMSQLVEERAASVGVSLEAPANEDPDVVAAAVASTGIDPTFLAALPEEMRSEVLAQHFEQVTTAREAEMAQLSSTTILAQEFLIALPPALRADVLAQEATYRSRNETGNVAGRSVANPEPSVETGGAGDGGGNPSPTGPADTDIATFLATLDPDLRREILITSGDSFMDQLPPHMAAEAQALRERDNARRTSAFGLGGQPRSMMQARNDVLGEGSPSLVRIDDEAGRGHLVSGAGSKESCWEYREQSDVWLRVRASDVDGASPLCSEKSLIPLLGLLNLRSSQYGKALLHQVLAALCKRSDTRRQVLDLLFLALPLRFENSSSSSVLNGARSPRHAGSATESVIVRRALELLTNLCKQEKSVAEDIIAVPFDDPVALGLPLFREGGDRVISSPAAALVSLLDTPLFQRSSSHQTNLIALLSYAFNALPPETAMTKKENVNSKDNDGQQGGDEIEAANTSSAMNETEIRPQAGRSSQRDEKIREKPGAGTNLTKVVHIPAKFRIPFLLDKDVQSLVNLLLIEGSNEKCYDRITVVLSRASELPANRERALSALTASASKLGDLVAASFEAFVSGLPSRTSRAARSDAVCKFSMSASTDELKFLRVLKAIVAVIHPSKGSGSSTKPDAVTSTESPREDLLEDAIGEHLDGLSSLWTALDTLLSLARDESYEVADLVTDDSGKADSALAASEDAERSGAAPWSNSRDAAEEVTGRGGLSFMRPPVGSLKSHSLSPMLARLSPVIEAFFVCHGARTAVTSEVSTAADSAVLSARSPSHHSSCSDFGHDTAFSRDKELGSFIKRNRSAVNSILRVNPLLLDGSFRSALRHAHAIDFDNKKSYFRNVIRKRSGTNPPGGSLRITVRRDRVFDDSYKQLRSHSASEMRGRLHVQFNGEEGIDAGGVTREWYVILARQIFDPNYALFCRSAAKAATYQPNKSSSVNQEHLDNFRFVGRIFGKAIYDGQLLDAYFTRAFYKHILGIKPTYHDIEAEDPAYYQSLCWILDNNITDVIEETFSSEYEEFGQQRIVDLKPNGRNIAVTEENKVEYVKLVTEVKLTKAIEQQIAAFKQGFHELIPLNDCRIFNEVELELLTSGLPDIDVADLKANVDYSGYSAGSPQISWFWNSVSKMGQEDLARFVMFVTGTSKVPIEGFAALQGMNGPQRLSIHRASCTVKTRLPSAHTCFNQLDLPEYDDAETLSERLLVAIRECSVGFGFG